MLRLSSSIERAYNPIADLGIKDRLEPKPSKVEPAAELQAPLLEPERSKLLTEALPDARLQAVKTQLERRGLRINTEEAQAIRLAGGEQLLIPFGESAHLVWLRTKGQTVALGLVRQGEKTLNITAEGEERLVGSLSSQQGASLGA